MKKKIIIPIFAMVAVMTATVTAVAIVPEISTESSEKLPSVDFASPEAYNNAIINDEAIDDFSENIDLYVYSDEVKADLGSAYDAEDFYGVNEKGETFGSDVWATGPNDYPELSLAEATNGKIGYVYREDLEGEQPSCPEEAVTWNETHKGFVINVYESDGETIIGEFVVGEL